VCDLLAKGLLNKQIAAEMGITEKNVQEYRRRAMQKLGLNSVAELARLWERQGK
jgi:DNA-binding NarL/FixJ family response regulator